MIIWVKMADAYISVHDMEHLEYLLQRGGRVARTEEHRPDGVHITNYEEVENND